jgi:two-component system sensor histidine kinase HydH
VSYITKRSVTGFVIGFAVGMTDVLLLWLLGVDMRLAAYDVTLAVVAFFAINFGLLGGAIGHLLDQREVIREQYEDLKDARGRAIQQEKLAAVGRLASSVAHEVRNPLGVIRTSASMLGEDADPASDDARTATFITDEVDRLDSFVSRVLDFTRPLEIDPAPVRVGRLIESATGTFEGVSIDVDDSVRFEADKALLVQALRNIIANARDVGDLVAVHVFCEDDEVVFRVQDDGIGVPGELRDDLFEPFFTTKASGTGLGLPMAKKIVELHDGRIVYREESGLGPAGRGACFEMRLPA